MQLRVAVLADYCNVADGEKLNICGIFSKIYAPAEPIVLHDMQLVLQFECDPEEAGQKDLRVELLDEDGRQILGFDGSMAVPRSSDGEPSTVNTILRLGNLKFPKFGCYEFRVILDGVQQTIIPVAVRKAKREQPTGPSG